LTFGGKCIRSFTLTRLLHQIVPILVEERKIFEREGEGELVENEE
jgi:hypothetical protein